MPKVDIRAADLAGMIKRRANPAWNTCPNRTFTVPLRARTTCALLRSRGTRRPDSRNV